MADNTVLNTGVGGDTIASDDIGGVKFPRSKIVIGADGTNDGDVSSANPLPVKGTGTAGTANSGVVTVQGIASMTPVQVGDNSGSLTVDAPVGTPVFVRLSDGSAAISALPVTDNSGSLTVDGTVTANAGSGTFTIAGAVTNAGTFVVQENGAALTALQLIDNLVLAEDAVHSTGDPGVQVFAVRKDTSTTGIGADGDYVPLAVNASGHLYTAAAQAGTWNIGTVTAVTSITNALPAGTNNIGDVDVLTVPADPFGANADAASATGSISAKLRFIAATGIPVTGTVAVSNANLTALGGAVLAEDSPLGDAYSTFVVGTKRQDTPTTDTSLDGDCQTLKTDSTGRLWCNVSNTVTVASHAVTNAGTFAVQAASAGDVAHDAGDAGNPVKIGAVARSSDQTAVANADRVNLLADLVGKLVTLPYAIPENFVSGVTAAMTGTGDTSVIAAAGAGVRNYVTSLTVTNSHATVGTVVEIKDGTTVIWRGYAAPAGGGFTLAFPVPLRGTANTAINAANVTTGSSTYVSAAGYKAP